MQCTWASVYSAPLILFTSLDNSAVMNNGNPVNWLLILKKNSLIINIMRNKQINIPLARLLRALPPCRSCLCREPWWSWNPSGSSSGSLRSAWLPRRTRKRRWWRRKRRKSAGVPAGRATARPAGDPTLPSLWVSSEKQIRHQQKQAGWLFSFFPVSVQLNYTEIRAV